MNYNYEIIGPDGKRWNPAWFAMSEVQTAAQVLEREGFGRVSTENENVEYYERRSLPEGNRLPGQFAVVIESTFADNTRYIRLLTTRKEAENLILEINAAVKRR